MSENYIDKIKKNNVEYAIKASSADTALVATTALKANTSINASAIGRTEIYSGVYGDKLREGLKITNSGRGSETGGTGYIEVNEKGNLSLESVGKHVNIEAKKGIQMKPTTTMTLDSSRRIEADKGNEFHIEARFDDYKTSFDTNSPYYNKTGNKNQWAELKIESRNLDLRCYEHGGIALQIAGEDGDNHENKLKFESDRISSIADQAQYSGSGGTGLEFGTFNNEHASLYCGDYRFKGNAKVYGVTREIETTSKKTDYITQPDDFKDIIVLTGETQDITPNASWNEIISAANKCKNKEAIASEDYVDSKITERIVEIESGGEISLDGYATTQYVQDYVSEHGGGGGGSYTAGNGIHIEDGIISVNNYSNIEPLTSLTNNLTALSTIKIGKDKGNFKVDVKGKYTYEANSDAYDENGHEVQKGGRVVNYVDEDFYNDSKKYYYKALVSGMTFNDEVETAFKGSLAYTQSAMTKVNPGEYFYIAKKNAIKHDGTPATKGEIQVKNDVIDYAWYYECTSADTKWTKCYVIQDGKDDEKFYSENSNWELVPLWVKNQININLESDSKIKFDGQKIETTWAYKETENGDEVDHRMESITLSSEDVSFDATNISFENKVTKNGDYTEEPMLNYTFENKLYDDLGNVVVTEEQFLSNFKKKHPDTELSDEEIKTMYHEYIGLGPNDTVSVKVSDLLRLVEKVNELELRIETLEGRE